MRRQSKRQESSGNRVKNTLYKMPTSSSSRSEFIERDFFLMLIDFMNKIVASVLVSLSGMSVRSALSETPVSRTPWNSYHLC